MVKVRKMSCNVGKWNAKREESTSRKDWVTETDRHRVREGHDDTVDDGSRRHADKQTRGRDES